MASRRKLKNAINFVSSEMITEMYILSFFKEVDEKKLDGLVTKVVDMSESLIARINHVDGKGDAKIVKAYFKKLRSDWTNGIEEVIKEVETL